MKANRRDYGQTGPLISVLVVDDYEPSVEDIISPAQDTIGRLGVAAVNYGERLRNLYLYASGSDGVAGATLLVPSDLKSIVRISCE